MPILILILLIIFTQGSLADPLTGPFQTNQPPLYNAFDLASGGTSLTRTTQEGAFFSNPSLSAFGKGFERFIFLKNSFHIGAESISLAKGLLRNSGKFQANDPKSLIATARKTPLHFGMDTSLGVITSLVSFSLFSSEFIDFQIKDFGTIGSPEAYLRGLGIVGAALSFQYEFFDTIAIGLVQKYLYASFIYKDYSAADVINLSTNQESLSSTFEKGQGQPIDAAVTLQKRSANFDIRLAGTVSNVGTAKFSNGLPSWKQSYNVGVGLTLHDDYNAFHCSADYRDVTGVYQEKQLSRFYVGCKAVYQRLIAVGFGLYQGWPTYGIVLSLKWFRLEAGSYMREFGHFVGETPRHIYFVTIGFEV